MEHIKAALSSAFKASRHHYWGERSVTMMMMIGVQGTILRATVNPNPKTPLLRVREVGVRMMPELWKYQRAVGLGLGLTVARMMHCTPSEDC